jgi:shikimate kinase
LPQFDKIFLTGFMGSGKSTHGKKLASELRYRFIDLDSYIEKKEGRSVQEIFAGDGESIFREKETQYLEEILKDPNPFVVSLGGGTVCFHDNINKVISSGLLIYIKMSPEALCSRLVNSVKDRPLLKNKDPENLLEYIKETLIHREQFYKKAHLTINGLDLTAQILAQKVRAIQSR